MKPLNPTPRHHCLPGIPLLAAAFLATGWAGAAETAWPGSSWALAIPGGGAGWLGIEEVEGKLQASLLWGGGSVLPLESARLDGEKLVVTRLHQVPGKDASGKPAKIPLRETITAEALGDDLKLVSVKPRPGGQREDRVEFTGKRLPPMPPAPNLSQVTFGEPVALCNGQDLTGWKLTKEDAISAWTVRDGILANDVPPREPGKPRPHFGNLRTEREFEDFRLTLEVRVPPEGNSGIYLRGIYEVQVADTHGKPLDSHNMGAIYSRITPSAAAEKPAGEWQTLEITLVDRHVTVVLNGTRILDNQPVAGCTGGALWADVNRPGPIYLQGDHTGVEYRHLELRPRMP